MTYLSSSPYSIKHIRRSIIPSHQYLHHSFHHGKHGKRSGYQSASTSSVREDSKVSALPSRCIVSLDSTDKQCRLGTSKVTVLVGPDESAKEFILHTDLVKLHSEVISKGADRLKAQSESRNQEKRPVRLPSDSAEDFEVFRAFIYTGHVYSIPENNNERKSTEWNGLAKLWMLGKSLQSTTFKDAVVDAVLHLIHTSGRTIFHTHETLAQHFHEPTGMTNLLVDIATSYWSDTAMANLDMQAQCLPFYKQVIIQLNDMAKGKQKRSCVRDKVLSKSNCEYHDHGTNNACYKTLFPTFSDEVRQKKSDMPEYVQQQLTCGVRSC